MSHHLSLSLYLSISDTFIILFLHYVFPSEHRLLMIKSYHNYICTFKQKGLNFHATPITERLHLINNPKSERSKEAKERCDYQALIPRKMI